LRNYGIPLFKQRIGEAQEANEDFFVSESDIVAIANDVARGNWLRRSSESKLTGEWIIYAQHAGANY
jgi:hypothetical protein